jgi:hypothetical protein
MPKLTLEQLKTLEALTGKQHSILNGKPRKTRRTPSQSFKLGLMIRPASITDNEERRVLVNIYETLFKYEITEYTDSLKLELLEKRYITELYDIGCVITFFDRNGNYKAEAITNGLVSRLKQSMRKEFLMLHDHEYIDINERGGDR